MIETEDTSWVVYLMTISKKTGQYVAVCEQHEWDAMEQARPGYHQLIQAGIATEMAAEELARQQTPAPIPGRRSRIGG